MWLGVSFSIGAKHRRFDMRGSRHHLILSKDRTRLISLVVDKSFVIISINGDLGDLPIKVGMPLGPAKMLVKAN